MGKWLKQAFEKHPEEGPAGKAPVEPSSETNPLMELKYPQGKANILDLMVRHLEVGDEEETGLTDDWEDYWPQLLALPILTGYTKRDIQAYADVYKQAKEQHTYPGHNYDMRVLSMLLPYIQNLKLFRDDFEAWENWVFETLP